MFKDTADRNHASTNARQPSAQSSRGRPERRLREINFVPSSNLPLQTLFNVAKQNYDEEVAIHEQFETLYETVVK
jgi:hypothetical protein